MATTFIVKSDATAFLLKQKRTIAERLRHGLYTGVAEFAAYEIKNEMSGRPGLNAPTGTLRRSWHVDLHGEGEDISATMANDAVAWYAIVHQTGKTIRPGAKGFLAWKKTTAESRISKRGKSYKTYSHEWIFTKRPVKIPKRLHIYENFQEFGRKMIQENINEVLSTI